MRRTIGLAALVILSACSQSPEVKLSATCTAVMADPEVQGDIRDANISTADYCACAATAFLALPEGEREEMITTFETMEQLMQEHDGSAEAAFRELSTAGRAEDATPEAIAAYESMDALGERLDDLLDDMRNADRACPV